MLLRFHLTLKGLYVERRKTEHRAGSELEGGGTVAGESCLISMCPFHLNAWNQNAKTVSPHVTNRIPGWHGECTAKS